MLLFISLFLIIFLLIQLLRTYLSRTYNNILFTYLQFLIITKFQKSKRKYMRRKRILLII
jgi:hypothetical protein